MLLRGNDDSRAGSPWVHKLQRRGPETPRDSEEAFVTLHLL